jgi:serine phosphatase RsbU (regulator of sigma subunit)
MCVDLATGAADVVNAGHPPPYLLRDLLRDGTIAALDVPPNLPLGMFEGSRCVEHQAQLRAGDRLVLVSDGLVEATDPAGEVYGEERLQGTLLGTAALSTAEGGAAHDPDDPRLPAR